MTIKRIAQLANVSSATVSKVMNGKDQRISEATRQRILRIIEEEGYIPNGVAKSLKVKKTKTIGIIMPDVMNPFFSELVRGAEDSAEAAGYSVIICNSDNKITKEEKYVQILQEKMVDGIILTSTEKSTKNPLERCSVPVVLVDRDIEYDKEVGRIVVENINAAYEATTFLIEKGCKEIGFISSIVNNKTSYERLRGFNLALLDHGQVTDENRIYLDNFTMDTGFNGAKALLKQTTIDGIFCGNDLIAIGAMNALKEEGIKVPEEVKIVGFDDISISKFMEPPITTVKQPIYNMGEEAVNMLVNIIEKKNNQMTKVLMCELIVRQST